VSGVIELAHDAVIEPFVEGRSVRVLLVGERAWQLEYASNDWRKNVRATVSVVDADAELVARARQTTSRLGLALAGVDYIVNDLGTTLLEVNAYPGLDDVPEAVDAFVEMAGAWWSWLRSEGA
jgi:glutathione synthase/RimK-type ligase-like ATP-grasp enzyme